MRSIVASRVTFAAAVTAVVLWLLVEGLPLGAVVVVLLGIWARRAAESGRLGSFATRLGRPS